MSILFAPFAQLQDYAGGTGLGLYSVQRKVDVLGTFCGTLWLYMHYISSLVCTELTKRLQKAYKELTKSLQRAYKELTSFVDEAADVVYT
jgi:hypothetical protein